MANIPKAELMSPVGQLDDSGSRLAPRLPSLKGKVGGFVNNGKEPAHLLLSVIQKDMSERFALKDIVWVDKKRAGGPWLKVEEMAPRVDFVVEAIAL